MDAQRFFQEAITIARDILPDTCGGCDDERAAEAALETAQEGFGNREYFECIDTLGGEQAVLQQIVAVLKR